jgi:hypothetical protein
MFEPMRDEMTEEERILCLKGAPLVVFFTKYNYDDQIFTNKVTR